MCRTEELRSQATKRGVRARAAHLLLLLPPRRQRRRRRGSVGGGGRQKRLRLQLELQPQLQAWRRAAAVTLTRHLGPLPRSHRTQGRAHRRLLLLLYLPAGEVAPQLAAAHGEPNRRWSGLLRVLGRMWQLLRHRRLSPAWSRRRRQGLEAPRGALAGQGQRGQLPPGTRAQAELQMQVLLLVVLMRTALTRAPLERHWQPAEGDREAGR